VEEKEVYVKKRDRNEDEDEKEFGGQQIPPLVRLGDPPLAVTDQGLALDGSDNEECPKKDRGRSDAATCENEKIWAKRGESVGILPRVEFVAGEEGQEGEGDKDFGPVTVCVFFEDVEDLVHGDGLDLL